MSKTSPEMAHEVANPILAWEMEMLERLKKLEASARADEREACALILLNNAVHCENPDSRDVLLSNAAAILARGADEQPNT